MILVFDPLCVGLAHEKFNAGFLRGLRIAFPDEPIEFWADSSHQDCVKKELTNQGVEIANLQFTPVSLPSAMELAGLMKMNGLLERLFRRANQAASGRVFFLSCSPAVHFLLQRILRKPEFRRIKLTIAFHGDLEHLTRDDAVKGFSGKVRTVARRIQRRWHHPWEIISEELFSEKTLLEKAWPEQFHFIALAPHIQKNLPKFMDSSRLQITNIPLPTNFAKVWPQPENEHIKFATFGSGNPVAVGQLGRDLATRGLKKTYEIKVIGSAYQGTEGVPHVQVPSPGRYLSREQMEELARDVDVFLILYTADRYRLSCTGSIMEALSYLKPIIHLKNECIEVFNRPERPIGISCENLGEVANAMARAIEGYPANQAQLAAFRENMLMVREQNSIENSAPRLKAALSW